MLGLKRAMDNWGYYGCYGRTTNKTTRGNGRSKPSGPRTTGNRGTSDNSVHVNGIVGLHGNTEPNCTMQ
jgi:hypothetical protein